MKPAEISERPKAGSLRTAVRRRWKILLPITAIVVVLSVVGALLSLVGKEEPVVADDVTGGVAVSEVSTSDLEKVARIQVFFGHQSVGMNILDGVAAVFAAHGVEAPPIEKRRTAPDLGGGVVAHAQIGQNTKPLQKIQDFDALIRDGMGQRIDVALMKFCYIDVVSGTDVDALFAAYRDTMAALEKDFPHVTFVKATVPLTTKPGRLAAFKQRLKGDDAYGTAAGAARERMNELIRKEYRGDQLFDLAAVESTAPDGSRVSGRHKGEPYFALHEAYASDAGHLNAEGSRRAATAWLAAIAQASSR